jgi:predicted ATPase/DNA-binding XRE family transcriptional regulator
VGEGTASFGALLRQLRSAASLSQEELAARAGLSVRGISDLERGARSAPRLETVRMLADALAVKENDRAALLIAARPALVRDGSAFTSPLGLDTLPLQLTRLIGREREGAALQELLAKDDVRLVTVTGAGGTGKTRLALDVASKTRGRYADGVCVVDLSPLTDPVLVIPTIAAALGVREVAGQPLSETLTCALVPKELLLVLDSCERVLAASPDITALLASSAGLTILATSREPLHLRGEREIPLLPLPLPAADRLPALEELASVPAVTLFVERATESHPDFTLTVGNAAAVAAICRRLDGLPLAIELAAARIKLLPPAALLDRLELRLPLLTGGSRDLPTRQRTMRDAIARSYDLLNEQEQALFRRLAVFAGGFTLEAAEVVAGPDGAFAVLDGLGALVVQSLLRQMAGSDAEPRYQMLETVREFGLERLTASGEAAQVRERHARHFLQLSDHRVHAIQIFMDLKSLTSVVPEQDNVRLALAWFEEQGEIDALLRLTSLLYGLWLAHGHYREGLRWLDRALLRSSRTASTVQVQALVEAGTLAIYLGDYGRAAAFCPEAVALAQESSDPLLFGQALTVAGFLAYRQAEYDHAEVLFAGADERLRPLASNVPAARADAGFALLILGSTALVQEQFDRAAPRLEEALELFRLAGNDWGICDAQVTLAAIKYCTGDIAQAAALYSSSIDHTHGLNLPPLVTSALIGLAAVAADTGRPEMGAHLLGAAEGMAASLGAPMFPSDRPVFARGLSVLRSALGEERLASEREVGRAMSVEQAVAEARAVAEAVPKSPVAVHI